MNSTTKSVLNESSFRKYYLEYTYANDAYYYIEGMLWFAREVGEIKEDEYAKLKGMNDNIHYEHRFDERDE